MTLLRFVVVCAAVVTAGCGPKPVADEPAPQQLPFAISRVHAPRFGDPPTPEVARVAAEVAPHGGTAASNTMMVRVPVDTVPAVAVEFPRGGPKEADVPDLVRRLTATKVPVTVVVMSPPKLSAEALGQLLGMPNLRGLVTDSPNLFAALDALGDDPGLEFLAVAAATFPDSAPLKKLRRLRVLTLGGPNLPAAVFDQIAELPDLHTLELFGVTTAYLPRVGRLTRLRKLRLSGDDFGDADLAPLATMANLRSVVLSGKGVTTEAFAHLTDLPELTNLAVLPWMSGYTDRSLGHVGRMKSAGKIEQLSFGGSAVTGAGLAHLRTLTGLKELNLYGVPNADAAGLAVVAALPSLVKLDVSIGHVVPRELGPGQVAHPLSPGIPPAAAFEGFAGAVAVKTLHLTNATDAHLLHVGKMPALEELVLTRRDDISPSGEFRTTPPVMSDTGLSHLRAAPRLRKLSADGCLVTDAGMAHVAAFPALTDLELSNAFGAVPLTDAGAATLATSRTLRVATISGYPVPLPVR